MLVALWNIVLLIDYKCKTSIKMVIICYQIFGKFAKPIKIDAQLSKLYNIFINNMKPKQATRKFTVCEVLWCRYSQPIYSTKGNNLMEMKQNKVWRLEK